MPKPLGFYTSVMPNDGSYLDHLQTNYGSTLSGLSTAQKLVLVQAVAANLMNALVHQHGTDYALPSDKADEAKQIAALIKQHVQVRELPGFLEALSNQINS